jgi:hypothetical protein
MVQILFLAPSLQRAAAEAITLNKMEEPEALVAVAERQPLLLEAEVLEIPHPQVHHKVTMAAMQSLLEPHQMEPVVVVVAHLPWVLMDLEQPLVMVAQEQPHLLQVHL